MNETSTEPLSVVVEREIPHPPEKIWRALTEPHLIEEWLMKSDFRPDVGHRFNFRAERADWKRGLDCEVRAIEPPQKLSYTWNFAGGDAAHSLQSVVTWTLTRISTG